MFKPLLFASTICNNKIISILYNSFPCSLTPRDEKKNFEASEKKKKKKTPFKTSFKPTSPSVFTFSRNQFIGFAV